MSTSILTGTTPQRGLPASCVDTRGAQVCVLNMRARDSLVSRTLTVNTSFLTTGTSFNNSITLTFSFFPAKTITRNTSLLLLFLRKYHTKYFNRFLILYIIHSSFKHIIIQKRFIYFCNYLFVSLFLSLIKQ